MPKVTLVQETFLFVKDCVHSVRYQSKSEGGARGMNFYLPRTAIGENPTPKSIVVAVYVDGKGA